VTWHKLLLVGILLLQHLPATSGQPSVFYHIDLTHIEADSFYVRASLNGFPCDTAVLVFAATAPGTYQRIDAGRFVGSFRAYDARNKILEVRHPAAGIFQISPARELASLEYRVRDSFGSADGRLSISPDEGSVLEMHGAILNAQMVCGYFRGFQSAPLAIDFQYPPGWTVGCALPNEEGTFNAASFDGLVDSPFLFGELSRASFSLGGTRFDVFALSERHLIQAPILVDTLRRISQSVARFLDGFPVPRYTFLFYFRRGIPFSAMEHHHSSIYGIPEDSVGPAMGKLVETVPHEMLHLITPLNVRSEVIEKFDFEFPRASRHIWFYEGMTEWAASMLLVRSGLISMNDFQEILKTKIAGLRNFDQDVSLVTSSLNCYRDTTAQWGNAYDRGMLVALMLDIRLHELSRGRRDLRDLLRALSKMFGIQRPFEDRSLFDIIVGQSYPSLRTFFSQYVEGTLPLPIPTYLAKVGEEYHRAFHTGRFTGSVGKWQYGMSDGRFVVRDPDLKDEITRQLQIQDGDTIVKLVLNNKDVFLGGGRLTSALKDVIEGEEFEWVVDRSGTIMHLKGKARLEEAVEETVVPVARVSRVQAENRRWWLTDH